MTKLFGKTLKQCDYRNRAQGSIIVCSSGTEGAQNYLSLLLVLTT